MLLERDLSDILKQLQFKKANSTVAVYKAWYCLLVWFVSSNYWMVDGKEWFD